MKHVLFYSNHCEHSRKILKILSQSEISNDISFVCIDSRITKDGTTYAVLETGKHVPLPNVLSEVPSLLMLEKGNSLVVGDKIMTFISRESEGVQMVSDPAAFSFNEMAGLSDGYAYLDVDAEEMLAKGNGGNRIMHSFMGLESEGSITTPVQTDDRAPSLRNVDMDQYMAQRINEVPKPIQRE